MRKTIIFLTLSLALLLAACSGGSASTNNETTGEGAPAPEATDIQPAPISAESTSSGAACTVVSSDTQVQTLPFAELTDTDWINGPDTAYVTFVEYSDFQCPYCSALAPVLKQLQADFPDDIRVVYRHFPLIGTPEQTIHDKAAITLAAAEAAGRQGAFWEMDDALFEHQSEWNNLSIEDFKVWATAEAEVLGLDTAQFSTDMNSEELAALAQEAWDWGVNTGLPGTPFLMINGRYYDGPMNYNSLYSIFSFIMLEKRQFQSCPEITVDTSKTYLATLHMEAGDVVIKLYPDVAPLAVSNFIFLAENDWYDGVTFFRVITGYVAQSGDPSGSGLGNPGYLFSIETSPELNFDRAGLFAMANAGPNANGSQFFITYGPAEHLNGGFTIFGEVVEGMEIINQITPRDPSSGEDLPAGDAILDVTIEVK